MVGTGTDDGGKEKTATASVAADSNAAASVSPPTYEDVIRESRSAITYIKTHLRCYNSFSEADPSQPVDETDDFANVCTGLLKFQKSAGIPQTGTFENTTARTLKQPHCHNHSGHEQSVQFIHPGRDKEITYAFQRYTRQIPVVDIRAAFERAFKEWGTHSKPQYTFVEVVPDEDVDIHIYFMHSAYNGPVPDPAITPDPFGEPGDQSEKYTWKDEMVTVTVTASPSDRVDIYFRESIVNTAQILQRTVFHLVGHLLGLGHSEVKDAVMFPMYENPNTTLHEDDIRAIREKYQPEAIKEYNVWKKILDPQAGRVSQIVAAPGGKLYRLDTDGSVWEYKRTGEWEQATTIQNIVQIDASSTKLYILHKGGSIWSRGTLQTTDKWELIDTESKYPKIIRSARDGKALYKLHGAESEFISVYSSQPDYGWKLIEHNPLTDNKIIDITTNASQVFWRKEKGEIYVNDGLCRICREVQPEVEEPPTEFIGSESRLYEINTLGTINVWEGVEKSWTIEYIPGIYQGFGIVAAGRYLYWYCEKGAICCDTWKAHEIEFRKRLPGAVADPEVDKIMQLAAADNNLYCLAGDGSVHWIMLEYDD